MGIGPKPALRGFVRSATAGIFAASLIQCGSAGTSGGINVCAYLDQLDVSQMYQIFEQAEQQLAAAGVTLTESAWTDPHQFSMFVDSVTDVAGCTDSEAAGLATSAQALHNGGHGDGTDDYCGPGHGVILPNVDPCLNEACRQHDGCYGQCSAKISLQCSWSKSTAPCDDPFMAAANACEIRVNPFRSHAVLWLARKFYNSTLLDKCAPGVWCPSPPALGPGPCGAGANASLCFDCLGQVDPGLACRESACADNPFDATCYTANCPNVGACYGGWGAGSGGSGGTGGTGATGGTSGTGGTGATGGTSGAGGVCSTVEEPNETEFAASDLGTIGDCDSSGGSLQAALSGSGDVDYFYFYGVDTFGCVVDPYASIDVANTQICLFSDCTVGCTTGTGTLSETSRQGCCSNTGAVQLSANCSGTNDSTGVYVRIQQLSGNACLPYTMDYSF